MRLIASIRLSKERDTSNSPATQKADMQEYADAKGHQIIAWTEDLDVSGSIPIREREGIGPWLADDKLPEWDGLIGYRMDRLFRSQLDYLLWVRDIGDEYGKVIIDTEDGTDTSTPAGRRALNDRVQFADYERQRMAERRSKAARRIRLDGRYGGGLVPFGLKKQRTEHGWILVEHEPYANETRAIARRILAGESANAIVMDMNKRGVPTSRNAQRLLEGREPDGSIWTTSQLLRYLRSPTLKGYVMNYPAKGKEVNAKGEYQAATVVYGSDGRPVRRAAILDDETWDRLQTVIGKRGEGRQSARRSNAATLLLGVAKCAECGGPLHAEQKGGRRFNAAGKEIKPSIRRYYGCQNRHYRGCTARLIPQAELDERVSYAMRVAGAKAPVQERKPNGGTRERELAEVAAAITDITEQYNADEISDEEYDEQMAKLRARRAALKASPDTSREVEWAPTGYFLADLWETLNTQQRRRLLLDIGYRWYASRDEHNQLHVRPEVVKAPTRYRVVSLELESWPFPSPSKSL